MQKYPIKKHKKPFEPVYDVENLVSTNECTGIAPTPPKDAAAADAYAKLYAIHRPKVDGESESES